MLQELYKFTRQPLFWMSCILLVIFSILQPCTTSYSKKASRSLYHSLYSKHPQLSEEEMDSAYFQYLDNRRDVAAYFKEEDKEWKQYDKLLKNIEEQELKSRLFYRSDSFVARNAKKTYQAYRTHKKVKLTKQPSLGITQYMDVSWMDYVLLLFGLYLCLFLVTREKQLQLRPLLKGTVKGYHLWYFRKYLAICLVMTGIYFATHICKWFVCSHLYEMGDLDRSIQSVHGLSTSLAMVNVKQYLILTMIVQWFAVLVLISLFFVICMLFTRTVTACLGVVILVGGEAALYNGISNASVWLLFKYLNLISFVDAGNWLGKYLNLNLLSFPVARSVVSSIVLGLLMVVCLWVIWIGYPASEGKYWVQIRRKTKKKMSPLDSEKVLWMPLGWWEQLKLLRFQRVWLVYLLLIGIAVGTYHPHETYSVDKEELYYQQYQMELAGDLTDDKVTWIQKEDAKFEQLLNENQIQNEDDLVLQELKDEILQKKLEKYPAFLRLKEYYEKMQNNRSKQFVYDTAYVELFTNKDAQQKILLLAELLLTVLVAFSGMVVYEKTVGMQNLITATLKGRKKIAVVKLAVAFLCYAIAFIIIYIPRLLALNQVYHFYGFSAPACSLPCLAWLPDSISILEALIGYHIFLFLWGGIYLCYVYLMSKRSSNAIQALALGGIGAIALLLGYGVIL